MAKYFIDPFAVLGDKSTIPDATQPDGTVSYEIGFGIDYQLDPLTDPDALNIPRDQFNQLMYDITLAIQQYQQFGFPDFITSADNGGSPFSYSINATVRYNGVNYYSLENANTDTPPSSKWGVVSFATASTFLPGDTMETYDAVLPAGWLWLDGKTIGSASSGGTARANADTQNLYTVLWNSIPNAALPIQDSAGVPTTRGISAAADFAANKRLPVPDKRGKVAAAADNLGGTAANILTGNTAQGVNGAILGNVGGEQSHTLITAELANHTHGATGLNGGSHSHTFTTNTNSAGDHFHVEGEGAYSGGGVSYRYGFTDTINLSASSPGYGAVSSNNGANTSTAGAHTHTVTGTTDSTVPTISGSTSSAGSGTTHNNVQPTIIANFRIKL